MAEWWPVVGCSLNPLYWSSTTSYYSPLNKCHVGPLTLNLYGLITLFQPINFLNLLELQLHYCILPDPPDICSGGGEYSTCFSDGAIRDHQSVIIQYVAPSRPTLFQ